MNDKDRNLLERIAVALDALSSVQDEARRARVNVANIDTVVRKREGISRELEVDGTLYTEEQLRNAVRVLHNTGRVLVGDFWMRERPAPKPAPVFSLSDSLGEIIDTEGGWNGNREEDRGGPTKYGVTQWTWDAYREHMSRTNPSKLPFTPMKVQDINTGNARAVYTHLFYCFYRLDRLPSCLRHQVLDCFINHRPDDAARLLQRAVGAEDDGVIGPQTVKRAHEYVEEKGCQHANRRVLERRLSLYDDIVRRFPDQEVNINGWRNRAKRAAEFWAKGGEG